MIFDFAAVKRSVQGLEERLDSLREETEQLRKKLQAAHYAPTARDDIKVMVRSWVRDSGAGYLKSFQDAIEAMSRNPVAMGNPARAKQLASFGAAGLSYGAEADPREFGQAMCALFGGTIADALVKAVDAMEWPANALTAEQRRKEIETLDSRIAKLRGEEAEILSKAAEAGINLE